MIGNLRPTLPPILLHGINTSTSIPLSRQGSHHLRLRVPLGCACKGTLSRYLLRCLCTAKKLRKSPVEGRRCRTLMRNGSIRVCPRPLMVSRSSLGNTWTRKISLLTFQGRRRRADPKGDALALSIIPLVSPFPSLRSLLCAPMVKRKNTRHWDLFSLTEVDM